MVNFSTIEEHYRKHYGRLLKSVTFRAGTEWAAQDCIQEAYTRCIKYWDSYNPNIEFGRWFSTILNNCIREYQNQERGHVNDEFKEEEAEGTPDVSHVHHVYWDVDRIIDQKPEPMKEILGYHFKQEYSAIDISRITSHSYANVHKIISRFREELKEIYGGE